MNQIEEMTMLIIISELISKLIMVRLMHQFDI